MAESKENQPLWAHSSGKILLSPALHVAHERGLFGKGMVRN